MTEAGYSPNTLQDSYPDDYVIEQLIGLIRDLGRYPVIREIKLRGHDDPDFPSHSVFQRRGNKAAELVAMVRQFCEARDGYDDVLRMIAPLNATAEDVETGTHDSPTAGFVYLMKSGEWFKLTSQDVNVFRRRKFMCGLPERASTVHLEPAPREVSVRPAERTYHPYRC